MATVSRVRALDWSNRMGVMMVFFGIFVGVAFVVLARVLAGVFARRDVESEVH